MTDLFDQLADIAYGIYKPHELAGVLLTKPLQTATERTIHIKKGDHVKVIDDELVDCKGDENFEIISCVGSMFPPFKIKLRNLSTNEEKTITI